MKLGQNPRPGWFLIEDSGKFEEFSSFSSSSPAPPLFLREKQENSKEIVEFDSALKPPDFVYLDDLMIAEHRQGRPKAPAIKFLKNYFHQLFSSPSNPFGMAVRSFVRDFRLSAARRLGLEDFDFSVKKFSSPSGKVEGAVARASMKEIHDFVNVFYRFFLLYFPQLSLTSICRKLAYFILHSKILDELRISLFALYKTTGQHEKLNERLHSLRCCSPEVLENFVGFRLDRGPPGAPRRFGEIFEPAIAQMRKFLNNQENIRAQIKSITEICKLASACHSQATQSAALLPLSCSVVSGLVGSDDLLAALSFCLVQASQPGDFLAPQLQMLNDFAAENSTLAMGEKGFALVSLTAAVEYCSAFEAPAGQLGSG